MSLRPVDVVVACVALHYSARSRGLQAFERGSRSQIYLVMCELERLLSEVCFNRGPSSF
jgi:hypothetical protein